MGTIPNNKFTLNQLSVQNTVPVEAYVTYWITIIIIKPNELAKPAINLDCHSDWSWNLIDPLTLKEFEKKKIKNKGKYIKSTNNISGWNILTPINQNL